MTELTGPRTYGNWRRPVQPGIASLGLLGTGLVFAGMICTILAWFVLGLTAGVVSAAVFAAVIASLAIRDRHGRSGLVRLTTRVGWARTVQVRVAPVPVRSARFGSNSDVSAARVGGGVHAG